MKLVVAVGGASGSVYARRVLDTLAQLWREQRAGAATPVPLDDVALCFSGAGAEVWAHEIGPVPEYPFKRWDLRDFRAPFASGSAGWDAMMVVPCSAGGLARIAHGISDDLIGRAADVMLKERRKLVLVLREMPLSSLHIENMLAVTRAGAVVMPASPSFYSKPATMEALIDTVVARALDQVGLHTKLMPRWGQEGQG